MIVARDGTLWIGTSKGLASWKEGKLTQLPGACGTAVDALVEDREGTIWVGTGKWASLGSPENCARFMAAIPFATGRMAVWASGVPRL